MRSVPALVATFSLAVAGCSFSSVDPDESVRVSGRALDAAGRPLTDTQVLLFKQADIGEVVFGTVLAVGTLATICVLPDAPAICRKARTTTTGSDGRYQFELKGSETQGTLGTASTLNVVFSGRKSSTTVSFTAEDGEINLPDARLWNASPKVSQRSGQIQLSYAPLPETGGKVGYSAQLFEVKGESALWTQPASGTDAVVDARILEDQPGSVAAGASSTLPGASGAGDARANYLSPRLPVRATAGTPLSRGRRCAAVTGTAPAQDAKFTKCGATDGDLDAPARLGAARGGVTTGAVVDLGAVRPIDLVVARGFAGQVLVELSDDGRTYRTVATNSGTAVALEVPGGQRARFVRLRSPSGLDESLAAELSVW